MQQKLIFPTACSRNTYDTGKSIDFVPYTGSDHALTVFNCLFSGYEYAINLSAVGTSTEDVRIYNCTFDNSGGSAGEAVRMVYSFQTINLDAKNNLITNSEYGFRNSYATVNILTEGIYTGEIGHNGWYDVSSANQYSGTFPTGAGTEDEDLGSDPDDNPYKIPAYSSNKLYNGSCPNGSFYSGYIYSNTGTFEINSSLLYWGTSLPSGFSLDGKTICAPVSITPYNIDDDTSSGDALQNFLSSNIVDEYDNTVTVAIGYHYDIVHAVMDFDGAYSIDLDTTLTFYPGYVISYEAGGINNSWV